MELDLTSERRIKKKKQMKWQFFLIVTEILFLKQQMLQNGDYICLGFRTHLAVKIIVFRKLLRRIVFGIFNG
jgi:hypothetical protein